VSVHLVGTPFLGTHRVYFYSVQYVRWFPVHKDGFQRSASPGRHASMSAQILWKIKNWNTPVDELDVNEFPSVILRAHNNTWVEVMVRYLVEPKNSGRVKKKLFEAVMEELKKYPEKVIFPNTKTR